MFKKVLLFCLSFLFLTPFFLNSVYSESEFSVDSEISYEVSSDGNTKVTHDIILENNFSTLYVTSYSLVLSNIKVNTPKAWNENGQDLTTEVNVDGDQTAVKIIFTDAVVGKGNKRHFYFSYNNSEFAVRTGEVWEISIPKLSDNETFRTYTSTLKVPDSFGLEAYISPHAYEVYNAGGLKIYKFDKEALLKTGVTAGFGEFQVFTFTLNYHLENPLPKSSITEIALPPDTALQKVYIRSLNPQPENIKVDTDGNWLAVYNLRPRQRVDVVAEGDVQIFSSERPFPKPTQESLNENLKETAYWQVNDPEIVALAVELKTPRAIYDYVSTNLKYDYSRVKPNIDRLGAKAVLNSPNSAICMEFTDLFIALARAAGIPAREINGYAYTENPDIQPLGLVADVLHSWPEYWDFEKNTWVPIDPTWAATTGGVNFFDKLDLRHFTFVIHGADPVRPYPPGSYKLGPNPQKDVFVSFGKLPRDLQNYPVVKAEMKTGIPYFYSLLDISIKNQGRTAFYSLYPIVYFDNLEFKKDFIDVLTPYSEYKTTLKIPYSFLGKNTPNEIRIEVDGSNVSVPVNKTGIIVDSLLALFIPFVVVLMLILWKNHQLNFRKTLEFIRFGRKKDQSTLVKP